MLPCLASADKDATRYVLNTTTLNTPTLNTTTPNASTLDTLAVDTLAVDTLKPRQPFFKRVGRTLKRIIDEFNNIDTNYIEPQHFKFTVMLQNTNTFDYYRFKTPTGESVTLSPDVHSTLGPYFGYSLIFLGYTLQLNHLYIGDSKKTFDLSLYTALFGGDLFYRNNNNSYKVKRMDLGSGITTDDIENENFDGLNVKSWGFNLYYIFNHRKHSYPATYNQSTCQKRSVGSFIAGFGYTKYNVSIDWQSLDALASTLVPQYSGQFADDDLFGNISYRSYELFGGYSFNWVPMKNLLIGASATIGVGYNISEGDNRLFKDFSLSNISLDGIGRIGIIWNNTRYYIGATGVIHSYNYSKDKFSLTNGFGNVCFYIGFNFGKKKAYRKPGRFFEF